MLNPTELINPRCQQTGTTPVLRTTHHLFLDLPKLTEELQAYIDETSDLGGWSSNCLAVSPALLLKDLAPPLLLTHTFETWIPKEWLVHHWPGGELLILTHSPSLNYRQIAILSCFTVEHRPFIVCQSQLQHPS